MGVVNITKARAELYSLVDTVNVSHEPVLIVGKHSNAVLIAESDWNDVQETLRLNAIPGMAKSIVKGAEEPLENCVSEGEENW